MKRVTKKYVTLLAAAVMMLLCSVVSLAEEECPLTIFGKKPVPCPLGGFMLGTMEDGTTAIVIIAGDERLEDEDIQNGNTIIREKQLNTADGKLPEFDIADVHANTFGTPGEVDFIMAKNVETGYVWAISIYRIPEGLTSVDELKEYKQHVIYVNGYQSPELALGWQENEKGSWYNYGGGEHPANEWKEIDGKWYFFNDDGYLRKNTWTRDGYYVDSTGAWIPGYDEDLVEGATVTYKRRTYLPMDIGGFTQLMPIDSEVITVPVSKVSDINRIYDNLAEDEVPELSRENAITFKTKAWHDRMREMYEMSK